MANPLKVFLDIRRGERAFSLSMFAYFFLVITSFWILKPIKKTLFIRHYDKTGFQLLDWSMTAAQAELLAKVLNMAVAFIAVLVFTWLARRLRRQGLTFAFGAFFLLCFAAFMALLKTPTSGVVWTFYLFGDLYSTLMVATFFAFLNDSVSPSAAKRLYGLIGLGGVLGGLFGSSVVRAWIRRMDASDWLWVCMGLGVLVMAAAALAGARVPAGNAARPDETDLKEGTKGSLLEGARLTFASPYLLSIAAMVGLYEIASTIMDFQFTAAVQHYLDGEDIGRRFATVYSITNWISMFVQLFLTSFVMSRFGVGAALLALPAVVLAGSTGFLALPVLWTGSLMCIGDNALSYSMNQSARESLYTVAGRNEKYQAKAFIDMFVQRFAKALAVGVSLLVTAWFTDFSALRWLSLATLALAVAWIAAVRFAGARFAALSSAGAGKERSGGTALESSAAKRRPHARGS